MFSVIFFYFFLHSDSELSSFIADVTKEKELNSSDSCCFFAYTIEAFSVQPSRLWWHLSKNLIKKSSLYGRIGKYRQKVENIKANFACLNNIHFIIRWFSHFVENITKNNSIDLIFEQIYPPEVDDFNSQIV
jgi:hypothetical protein